ncbi:cold-shock protein [Paenibacillaceae sp. P-4]|uniref:cold-inducible protein YdjO-related protein n=1 Tax=Paenibacillaceae bacterium P-4 TaxID=3160969 RepID=UPI001580AD77
MYYAKKQPEPVPEEQTSIWQCSQDGCPCWMRENFTFDDTPICPICQSTMVESSRMLPTLTNNTNYAHTK